MHMVACRRRAGDAGFTLLEMLVAVAVLAVLVALIPRSFVQARVIMSNSQSWTAARLVADAVLNDALAGPDLQPGTMRGVADGREWRAVIAPNAALSESGLESGRMLLDVRLRVTVEGDQALQVETMRIGNRS